MGLHFPLTIARVQGDLMHAVRVCVASVGDGVLQGSACHWIPMWSSWLFRHARATEAPSGRFSASEVYEGDKRYDAVLRMFSECFLWVVLYVVWSIWSHARFHPSVSACIADWLPASIVEISGGIIQDVWRPLLNASHKFHFHITSCISLWRMLPRTAVLWMCID